MKDCWHITPTARPSFSEICDKLRSILEAAAPDYGYIVPIPVDESYISADSLTALRIDNV